MPSFTSGWPNFAASRRDANVTRHRQLAAAAEREAVHRRDDRLGRRLEAAKDVLAAPRQRLRLRSATWRASSRDVGAGDERATGAR